MTNARLRTAGASAAQRPPRWINPWAVASAVIGAGSILTVVVLGSLMLTPFGVGMGHVALHQISVRKERGRSLAIAGLAICYGLTVVSIAATLTFYF